MKPSQNITCCLQASWKWSAWLYCCSLGLPWLKNALFVQSQSNAPKEKWFAQACLSQVQPALILPQDVCLQLVQWKLVSQPLVRTVELFKKNYPLQLIIRYLSSIWRPHPHGLPQHMPSHPSTWTCCLPCRPWCSWMSHASYLCAWTKMWRNNWNLVPKVKWCHRMSSQSNVWSRSNVVLPNACPQHWERLLSPSWLVHG